jgi:hypothetical protein
MPKITKHGGPTIYSDTESFLDSLGESEPALVLEEPKAQLESDDIGLEIEPSVGNNSSLSSEKTPTIDELLKGNRQ